MSSLDQRADGFWRKVAALLGMGRDKAPVDSVAALEEFLASRSAYVAQKTLYGYVKTRMGTRYVIMFDDEKIVASLNIAKLNVFAACLSDLTVYAVAARAARRGGRQRRARGAGAALLSRRPCAKTPARRRRNSPRRRRSTNSSAGSAKPTGARARGGRRISRAARAALVRWAPIADKLKRLDSEVVENSVKFAWRDIREQFNKRLDAAAVAADWARQAGG